MDQGVSHKILENEANLVNLAVKDDDAFEVLYDHYFPRIYGYVFKRVGSHEVAEDLVSQVFMKVFTNLRKYKHKGHTFGAWIYKIATNLLIDHYRKAGRKKEFGIEHAQNIPDEGLNLENQIYAKHEVEKIKMVVAKLNPKYQEILHLKFFAEMEYDEIAQTLGLTVNNTRVQLHRALKKFKIMYESYVK